MNRACSTAAAFVIIAVSSASADEKPVEIPLKEVWALNMPGTRDIRELPTVHADARLIEQIRSTLKPKLGAKEAMRGFVVEGVGDDALRRAGEILIDGKKPTVRFPKNRQLTAVFFSYESPWFVHLNKVLRKEFAVRIGFRLLPHAAKETTQHLALIPLGELPAGNYGVRVELDAADKKQDLPVPSESTISQLVCRGFHFIVVD